MSDDIGGIITDRATAYGVDPQTLLRIGQVESRLDPNAANPNSSASGLFQFTKPTWSQYGNGADPNDPYSSADAAARLTRDNAATLTNAGVDPTPGSLYLAHFAGAGTAGKLLTADPSAPASDIFSPGAIAANPFLKGMSAGDVRDWAAKKMGASPPVAGAGQQQDAAGQPLSLAPPQQQDAAGASPMTGMLNGMDAQGGNPVDYAARARLAQMVSQATASPPLPKPIALNMQLPPGLIRARLLASLLPGQKVSG